MEPEGSLPHSQESATCSYPVYAYPTKLHLKGLGNVENKDKISFTAPQVSYGFQYTDFHGTHRSSVKL